MSKADTRPPLDRSGRTLPPLGQVASDSAATNRSQPVVLDPVGDGFMEDEIRGQIL